MCEIKQVMSLVLLYHISIKAVQQCYSPIPDAYITHNSLLLFVIYEYRQKESLLVVDVDLGCGKLS